MKITVKEGRKDPQETVHPAIYTRVSRHSERGESSLENQRTALMRSYGPPNGKKKELSPLPLLYSDGFRSGTDTRLRPEFNRLVSDAMAGKVDSITVKSVSRFARNTVDLLTVTRTLAAAGVPVRFEKESLDSLSPDGELLLTLYAMFAESESRSISQNVRFGIRRMFEQGRTNHYILYGYRWNGKEFDVVPEEATVVRRIFGSFLAGISPEKLEKRFAEEGILTAHGCRFSAVRMRAMLENTSYCGVDLLGKEYISDPLTHQRRKNEGEKPMWRVENARPAIVPIELFDAVARRLARSRERIANRRLSLRRKEYQAGKEVSV